MGCANVWRDLQPIAADFGRWTATSGFAPSLVLVPLWWVSDAEVESWSAESCAALTGCAVRGRAWYPGVELGPSAWQRRWAGVAARLLRRTGEIAIGTQVYCASVALHRVRSCEPDAHPLEVHARRPVSASGPLCGTPPPRTPSASPLSSHGSGRFPQPRAFGRPRCRLSSAGVSMISRVSLCRRTLSLDHPLLFLGRRFGGHVDPSTEGPSTRGSSRGSGTAPPDQAELAQVFATRVDAPARVTGALRSDRRFVTEDVAPT